MTLEQAGAILTVSLFGGAIIGYAAMMLFARLNRR